MREKKLSARFEAIAGFVVDGEAIADIGSDHALLPLFLVKEGISPYTILTDISDGPLERTRARVDKAITASPQVYAGSRFDLRLGDGLNALSASEVDTVVIAGIGGETIVSMLESDPVKTKSFRKYILQPRTRAEMLGRWLAKAGWEVFAKTKVKEKWRVCDIIVCTPREVI